MELLPQVKVKFDQKDRREKEIFRKIRVEKSKAEQEIELHKMTGDIESQKKRIKAELDSFLEKAEKRKSDLLGEIMALEVKRDRIMEPFYQIKSDAQEMIDAAQSYERRIKEEAKKLNAKSDELNEREKWINEREKALLKKEQ